MNKLTANLLGLSVLMLMSFTASAQETWSLERCISYALENNLQVQQSSMTTQMRQISLEQSKFGRLPSLNGFASHNYNIGQRIDPFTNQFANEAVQSNNFYLNTQVTLFGGFVTSNRIRQNAINLESSKLDAEEVQNNISLSVANMYLTVLFNEELLKIAENQLNITKQQLVRMGKLVEAGAMPKGSLLEIEAQSASEELQIVTSQNNLDISRLSLMQLMELDSVQDFRIARPKFGDKPQSVEVTPGLAYSRALQNLPQIKSANLQLEGSALELNIAKGGRYPSLTFQAAFGTGYSGNSKELEQATYTGDSPTMYYTSSGESVLQPSYDYSFKTKAFADQVNQNLNQSIGFNLSIPIFNGFSAKYAEQQARVNIDVQRTTLESVQNQVEKTIQQVYLDAVAAQNKFVASAKSVNALQESFVYTEKRFEVGLVNAVDYNDAKNKLAKAQSDLLQAKYDNIFRIKILDFYQGKPIVL